MDAQAVIGSALGFNQNLFVDKALDGLTDEDLRKRPNDSTNPIGWTLWHQYRVELYPHTPGLIAGRDQHGNALEFPSWFRLSRRSLPSGHEHKGIVKLRRKSRSEQMRSTHRRERVCLTRRSGLVRTRRP